MSSRIKAVIDVGTNSAKLLIAELCDGLVCPINESSRQTRLGQGLYKTHELQKDSIVRTVDAVNDFACEARELGADIQVIATSAARDARNVHDLIHAIHECSGLELNVISGKEEAELIYRGVSTGVEVNSGTLLIVDVGGGSTELIIGKGEQVHFYRSLQIGTVRMLERFEHSNPPTDSEFSQVQTYLKSVLKEQIAPGLDEAGGRR